MRERRPILFPLLLLIVSVVSGGLSHRQCLGPLVTLKCVCAWGVCVYVCNEPLFDLWLSPKTSKVPGCLFVRASK